MDGHRAPVGGMPPRRSARPLSRVIVAWALGLPTLLLLGGGTLAHVASGGDIGTTSVALPIAGITSLSMGGVLVTRLPQHRVGWLLWIIGMSIAITVVTQALADRGLNGAPGSVPGAVWFAWVSSWAGELALFVPLILLPLLYPTGRPPSPRWRPVEFAGVGAIAAWAIGAAIGQFDPGTYPSGVENPLAIGGRVADLLTLLPAVLDPLSLVLLALALISLVVRYRRAAGVERQQIRSFAFVGAFAIVALLVAGGGSGSASGVVATVDALAWFVSISAIALMPVAIGLAILRYRLYEIDRLISRTIGYGVVTAILATLFAGGVLGLQAVLAPFTGSNTLAVAGSTLLVAALFQPLRRRIQRLVDRRFNRASYDAERTVTTFAGRLRDEVDLEALEAEITATVSRTVEPVSVALWVRQSSSR